MAQCKIILENYSGIYEAGSQIVGRVECYFNEEITVRGIKIRLKCKEHNEWLGSESYTDHNDNNRVKQRTVNYTGTKIVFERELMLYGSSSGNNTIGHGRHVYPFTFALPEEIPSTFNGPHGCIAHSLKAIVDRPMRTDYEDKFIIVVRSSIDFNKSRNDDVNCATSYSDEKSVCCFCCRGGLISMDVMLPKSGYAVGETIDFQVKLTNLSNRNVENLQIDLSKRITYKVTSPSHESKEDRENIVKFSEHGVGAHGEHIYDLQLAIPQYLEVPNFAQCSLFSVTYKLKVIAEIAGCSMDLGIDIYPELGHIPYRGGPHEPEIPGFVSDVLPPHQPAICPPYPSTNGAYPTAPYGDYSAPPPSYPGPMEKAVFPGGAPSAPALMEDNPKAREAGFMVPEMPPPSYSQVEQNYPPYTPK